MGRVPWYSREGDVGQQMLQRRYPLIGKAEGVFPFIHIDDAAEATVKALTGPPGIYNVVDDDPAPMKEWIEPWRQGNRAARDSAVESARMVEVSMSSRREPEPIHRGRASIERRTRHPQE